jgi:hypothetical protein
MDASSYTKAIVYITANAPINLQVGAVVDGNFSVIRQEVILAPVNTAWYFTGIPASLRVTTNSGIVGYTAVELIREIA